MVANDFQNFPPVWGFSPVFAILQKNCAKICERVANNFRLLLGSCLNFFQKVLELLIKELLIKTCTLGCNHTILSLIWACYTSKEREKQELYAEQVKKFGFIHWIWQ